LGKKVGIRDLARLAGVSIGTVDRVVNNREGVSKSTREKVKRLIEETGYERNVYASRLASRAPLKIACLLPQPSAVRNYWQLHIDGIHDVANELQQMGIETDFYPFPLLDREAFLKQSQAVAEAGYKALISVPFFTEDLQVLKDAVAEKSGLTVLVDTAADLGDHCHRIFQEPFRAGRVGGRLLESYFRDEPGHLLTVNISRGSQVHQNNFERARGIRDFFQDHNNLVQVSDHNGQLDDTTTLYNTLQQFVGNTGRKAIFVTNARAYMVAEILEQMDLNESVKVIGFDLNERNIHYMRCDRIAYLIHQKPYYQGQLAVRRIYDHLLVNGASDQKETLVPIEIVVKENLADYIDS